MTADTIAIAVLTVFDVALVWELDRLWKAIDHNTKATLADLKCLSEQIEGTESKARLPVRFGPRWKG